MNGKLLLVMLAVTTVLLRVGHSLQRLNCRHSFSHSHKLVFTHFSSSGREPINNDLLRKVERKLDEHGPEAVLHDIVLTPEESELFNLLAKVAKDEELSTTIRVVGGWVRDRLLGLPSKDDIDIALDNMSGKQFADVMNHWVSTRGLKAIKFGVIQQNPDKSKHLETGKLCDQAAF